MKKIVTLLTLLFFANLGFAQNDKVISLIKEGIKHHDAGAYEKAIASYKQALEIEPNSSLANYEISLSYMRNKDYKNAIKYSDKVLKLKEAKHELAAYMVKGSALDLLGETSKSIKLFKKAIKKYRSHLLNYNLALNYFKLKDLDNAEKYAIQAIEIKTDHASSHFMLGNLHSMKGNKVQAVLAIYYALFLEPNSERAKGAYGLLKANIASGVKQEKDNPNKINLSVSGKGEFAPAELMLSMLAANRLTEKNKDKTEQELFRENTASFFAVMGELKENNKQKKNIWWEFYTPFFYKLSKSDHMEAFCHFISLSSDEVSLKWLKSSDDKVKAFAEWLKKQ
ncbi:hypothetical protein BKI52_31365 [marine bacterium AO1-C]|nr:hypothetical protein BKI52_31365 [marine bacterium AO1-C]